MRISSGLIIALSIGATGCADDDGDSGGVAPVISNLTYQPTSTTAGAPTTITGTLAFVDPDKDLTSIAFQLVTPSGERTPPSEGPLQGVKGLASGVVGFSFVAIAPTAGAYTFDVWVEDAKGLASSPLNGTLAVP